MEQQHELLDLRPYGPLHHFRYVEIDGAIVRVEDVEGDPSILESKERLTSPRF